MKVPNALNKMNRNVSIFITTKANEKHSVASSPEAPESMCMHWYGFLDTN